MRWQENSNLFQEISMNLTPIMWRVLVLVDVYKMASMLFVNAIQDIQEKDVKVKRCLHDPSANKCPVQC